MPGDVLHANVATLRYIGSDYAFRDASLKGRLDVLKGWITGREPYLLSFREVVGDLPPVQAIYRGLLDIPVAQIVGSTGRQKEFSRHFYPLSRSERQRERWRASYTMAATGVGYPPIDVYQIGRAYFVINGHHRVSVARYLNWRTIQAHVSDLPLSRAGAGPISSPPDRQKSRPAAGRAASTRPGGLPKHRR
jgi:hypothetical protein